MLQGFLVFPASRTIDETIFPQSAHSLAPGTTLVEPYKKLDRNRHVYHLKQGVTTPPSLSVLEFRSQSESLQSADDPFTVATVVDKLHHKHSCKNVALNIPLHWESPTPHGLDALELSLAEYDTVTLSSELVYRSESSALPFYIARIPPANITGSPTYLPKVNAEALPPSMQPPTNTMAGFSSTTSVANQNQLLLRWGKHTVPSFSLLQLAMTEKLDVQDITVVLGRCIILGETGPVLAIDRFGAYSGTGQSQPVAIHAADYPWTPNAQLSPNAFLSLGPKSTAKDMLALERIHAAPRADFLTSYQRLDNWAELIVLADVAILFAWFLGFRPVKRHIYFLLVIVTLWPVLVALSSMRNMWTPASAVFATAITGWISSFFLAPLVQDPLQESDTVDELETENLT